MKRLFSVILLFLPILVVFAQDETAIPPSENVFGIVEGFWLPERACELGVSWERIIFDWVQHQPTGPDDWHTLGVDDRWLKSASDCGREIVALLKHTPEWATDGVPNAGVPSGLDLPIDDPNNYWANFVRRTAEYYASRGVNHFIIWNEPDIEAGTYGFEFEGGVEEYYQLLRVAYLAAKQGNPNAVIHVAGMTYFHDTIAGRRLFLDRLLERITADPQAPEYNYYFDTVTLHIYFRSDTVFDLVQQTRELLDSYGLQDKTIWINETNAAPTDDPMWPVERPVFQLNLEQQAAFLTQAAALGLAAGAERIAVYKLYDQMLPPGGESFGILSPADQSLRPAFYAWRTVVDLFRHVTAADRQHSEFLDAVRLNHTDGHETLVLWAKTQTPVSVYIPATGTKARLIDQYGNIIIVWPDNGGYLIDLQPATCNDVDGCPVGGPVSMLIQPQGTTTLQQITSSSEQSLQFE